MLEALRNDGGLGINIALLALGALSLLAEPRMQQLLSIAGLLP